VIRPPILLVAAIAICGAPRSLIAQKAPPRAARPQAAPAPTPGKVFRPATPAAQAPAAAVTPQAARAAAPTAGAGTFTAGLAMAPFTGGGPGEALAYGARFGRMLDSTIVTLVEVFRNTSGQPMSGAASPASLSQRERDRWSRCRNLYWDLTSYQSAVRGFVDSLPQNPGLQQAAEALDSALSDTPAVAECDNVASMIAAPERWTPWQSQYETAAQHFYRQFYGEIREAHERDRAFVNALNAVLDPARRVPVPPGLPRNPPYAGAAPTND
jgi:hypothetical protein